MEQIIASSAESVVEFGLREVPHHMKQREFDALWRAEAIRFSGSQFRLAIESLDDACRDGAQGEEPVEDQRGY